MGLSTSADNWIFCDGFSHFYNGFKDFYSDLSTSAMSTCVTNVNKNLRNMASLHPPMHLHNHWPLHKATNLSTHPVWIIYPRVWLYMIKALSYSHEIDFYQLPSKIMKAVT